MGLHKIFKIIALIFGIIGIAFFVNLLVTGNETIEATGEGVEGFIEALKYGTTDEDFYRMLKDKLNISPETFDSYVKAEAAAYSKN